MWVSAGAVLEIVSQHLSDIGSADILINSIDLITTRESYALHIYTRLNGESVRIPLRNIC
jgi:hypothetical protein